MDPKQLNIAILYVYEQDNIKSLSAKWNQTSPHSQMSIFGKWEFPLNLSNFCQFPAENAVLSLEYLSKIPKTDFFE